MRILRSGVAAVLAAGLVPAAATAQTTLTPRALGMGGAYVASARGHEALFVNPANLGLTNNPYWSVGFPQVAAGSTFTGLGFGDVKDLFNADDLPDARGAEILAAVPEAGVEAGVDVRLPLFVFQNRRFSAGLAYGAVFKQTVGRDLVDLVVNGYQNGRTDYSVGNTVGSRATYLDFAVGHGRKIGPVSLGVTGHYLIGRQLAQTRLFEPRFDLEREDLEVEYREVLAGGGNGWSVDAGAAYEPTPNLTVSAAVSNVAGSLTWGDDLTTRTILLNRADFQDADYNSLKARLVTSEEAVDPDAAAVTVRETARGLYEDAFFPTTLRAGVAWRNPETKTHVAASYQDALTGGRLGGAWERQLSLGVEQKVPVTTLRAGISTDLGGARMLTGGLTLGPVNVGLGRVTEPLDGGVERKGWVATFGLSMRTTGSMPVR